MDDSYSQSPYSEDYEAYYIPELDECFCDRCYGYRDWDGDDLYEYDDDTCWDMLEDRC